MHDPSAPFHPLRVFGILLTLLLFVLAGMLLGSLVTVGLAGSADIDLLTTNAEVVETFTPRQRVTLRLALLFNNLFAFALPAIATVLVFYRDRWASYLHLRRGPDGTRLGLAILLLLVSFPLIQFTYWLNQQLDLPEWMARLENQNTGLVEALLTSNSIWEVLLTVVAVAVTPAIGEELVFRGIVQQEIERGTRNAHLGVWLSALIFSTVHLQFAGFLPRFLLGAVLGYTYVWSRNLWVPIILHFLFNGLQVVASFFIEDPESIEKIEEMPSALLSLGSLLLVVGLGYMLWERRAGGGWTGGQMDGGQRDEGQGDQ